MTIRKHTLIPTLTTSSGSCLTAKNWQEAGIQRVSYSLAALLVKPGLAYLKTLPNWAHYSGWAGDWVLNASMPTPNSKGNYAFRSPYDGARLTCSAADIVDIICHLKPQQVVVPEGFYTVGDAVFRSLSQATRLLIPVSDREHYPRHCVHGVYYAQDQTQLNDLLDLIIQHQADCPDLDCYMAGSLSFPVMKHLYASSFKGKISLESDYPASDGCEGIVYCREGMIDLREKGYSMQFERIDPACHCPTCEQSFARAYLHHLLEHTPLLCQRLLIQHNAYYCLHVIG